MPRVQIEQLIDGLERALRTDPWHSLLGNLGSITEDEWSLRPAEYSVELFGTDPELSVGDIARHVAGAFVMYTNRAFGDGTMTWDRIELPGAGKDAVLAWLQSNVEAMQAGLAALPDDADLDRERVAHWGMPIAVRQFVHLMTNHMLYHAGEINRQISIIRGTGGDWIAKTTSDNE